MTEQLQAIYNRLENGHEYIIYPLAMGDEPIELSKTAKIDEDGNQVGYYTINELSAELPKGFLKPIPYIDDRFMLIRWAFDKGVTIDGYTDESATIELLKSKGLADMREGKTLVSDIDFTALNGDEFGIFGSHEIGQVPKVVEVTNDNR